MNITLSADARLIEKTRQYAKKTGTSLNQLVRDYLGQLVQTQPGTSVAAEFRKLATQEAGCSPAGYRFDRDAAHQRR